MQFFDIQEQYLVGNSHIEFGYVLRERSSQQ